MKKLISLLLALLLIFSCQALAETVETEESPFLTYEELEIYLSSLAEQAMEDENLTILPGENGASEAVFSGGSLFIADETLSATTAILGAFLSYEQEDPRGLRLNDTLEDLLAAYPNDNPRLTGSYYDAVLYMSGEMPEMTAGYVLRDGQRVTSVTHCVYSWQQDGVIVSGVEYHLSQGVIDSINVFGMMDRLEEAEAAEAIQDLGRSQEISEYFAYPQSVQGDALAPFQREDLSFSGVDFLDLTAESAIEAFGPVPVDEWTQDSNGEMLRLMQWNGLSLVLVYDSGKNFLRVDSLIINDDVMDGPRGVRPGDWLDSVIFRFQHLDLMVDNDTLLLYGDGTQPPYGLLTYSPDSAELSYALSLEDGRTVLWHMTFQSGTLKEMSLLAR